MSLKILGVSHTLLDLNFFIVDKKYI
jgi:hypothetical protein